MDILNKKRCFFINVIQRLLLSEELIGSYINRTPAPYRRIIYDGIEATLVGRFDDIGGGYLYLGEIGAICPRLDEECRIMTSDKTTYSMLYANNVRNDCDYYIIMGN